MCLEEGAWRETPIQAAAGEEGLTHVPHRGAHSSTPGWWKLAS